MLNPAEQKWSTSHLFKIENEKKEFSSFQCFERTLYTKLPSLNFKALLSSERHIQLLRKKKKKRKRKGIKEGKKHRTPKAALIQVSSRRVSHLPRRKPSACLRRVRRGASVWTNSCELTRVKMQKQNDWKKRKNKEIQSGKNRGKKKINEKTNTNKKYNTTRTHDQVHLEKTEVRRERSNTRFSRDTSSMYIHVHDQHHVWNVFVRDTHTIRTLNTAGTNRTTPCTTPRCKIRLILKLRLKKNYTVV